VIDGPSALVEATRTAVKQWRYEAAAAQDSLAVRKFVVVVTFGKGGKVQ